MSYTVLARKLRPDSFAALVGQDHVVRALSHGLDHDRLHHAYLFTGTRGVGKTTIARILAKALNCEQGVSATPCGRCDRCVEVSENRFIDLIEVDAASRTGVDDTRDLLDNAQYLPTIGRYKVYLIDEVHMLSKAAFNALLKTLEEPPQHVKFLLATTDPKKVPITVLSRCLQFQLKNLSWEAIAAYLAQVLADEAVVHDEPALELIARAARGSMRDALSITDQAIAYGQGSVQQDDVATMLGSVGRDEVGALMSALASAEAARVLDLVAELSERAADCHDVLSALIAAFHDLAVQQSLGENGAYEFSQEAVQLNYQIGLMGLRDMQVVPDPRLGLEMTLLRMLTFAPTRAPMTDSEESGARTKASALPAPINSPSGANSGSQAKATESVAAKALPVAAAVEKPVAQTAPELAVPAQDQWYAWVAELDISGVGRMLVEHSVLQDHSGDTMQLLLDPAHDTLLSDAQVAAVQRAVTELLAQPVTVQMTTGIAKAETPAQRNARLAAERQARARQSVETDATVQTLLSEFGGRVEAVAPIDDSATDAGVS